MHAKEPLAHSHAWGTPSPPLVTLWASSPWASSWSASPAWQGCAESGPRVSPAHRAPSPGSWAPRADSLLQSLGKPAAKPPRATERGQVGRAGNSRAGASIASWLCTLGRGTSSPHALFSTRSGECHAAAAAVGSSLSLAVGSRDAQQTSQHTRKGTRTSTLPGDPHWQPHGEAWDPLALRARGSGLCRLRVSLCCPGLSAEPL